MSQQLSFYLKRRDNKNIKVELLWYSTTPARLLSSEGIFPYTEKETIVSISDLTDAIENTSKKMSEYTKYMEAIQSKICRLENTASKCKTAEAINALTDKIEDRLHDIEGYTGEIEDWQHYKSKIEFIKEVLQENSEDWDLYYYNC